MEAEETNFHLEGPLTAETVKKFISDQLVPAVTKLLQPYLERLEFLNCTGIPQDGRRLDLAGPELERFKLRREFEIILRGGELYG